MAARRFRPGEKLLDLRSAEQVEGYEVHSHRQGQAPERRVLSDAPPGPYTERMPGEHGEVRIAPMVDALMRRLRRGRGGNPA